MRCLSCDKVLFNSESVRKHAETGEFIDLCDYCFSCVQEVQFIPTLTSGVLDDIEENESD
jgi:hypothetical protein